MSPYMHKDFFQSKDKTVKSDLTHLQQRKRSGLQEALQVAVLFLLGIHVQKPGIMNICLHRSSTCSDFGTVSVRHFLNT